MPPIHALLFPLSIFYSTLLAVLFSVAYVGSLYVAKIARLRFGGTHDIRSSVQPGSRDDPAIIRDRLTAATMSTVFSCSIVYVLVTQSTAPSPQFDRWLAMTLTILGVRGSGSTLAYFQTPVLFLGPVFASYLGSALPFQRNYSLDHNFYKVFWSWIGFRNYLWGPLTEEIVFRACVLSVYAMGGASRVKMIVFAPLVFGLAHVHHAWDVYNRLGRTRAAIRHATLSALFQTAYTTLFGAHTSFLFLRTSSLGPPLTAHIFCNIMGVPQIGAELRRFPAHKTSIIAVYIIGIVLFLGTLRPWTAVKDSLYWHAPEDFWRLAMHS
ncbi:hypothetical protein GGX14DRAFT_523537 [Mycena pura]|uniref:intramembrane prenyl-peptidase Rce1 n=1 Tax=Mycena pura TaxID=153505 RepID=A0AAD6YB36_9AGAR|nr:hypothetical protein GGX14DRAFT_523537 [Mycena pura]